MPATLANKLGTLDCMLDSLDYRQEKWGNRLVMLDCRLAMLASTLVMLDCTLEKLASTPAKKRLYRHFHNFHLRSRLHNFHWLDCRLVKRQPRQQLD